MLEIPFYSNASQEEQRVIKKSAVIGIGILTVIIVVCIIVACIPAKQKNFDMQATIVRIKELATYEAVYHNVAQLENKGTEFLGFGYKKFWIEYEGTVELGIDAEKLFVGAPSEEGVIDVYLPDAKVLNASIKDETMSDPITETALFVTISADEKTKIVAEAQKNMKETAAADGQLLSQAKDRAKELVRQYFNSMGEALGSAYTINWLDSNPNEAVQ